MFFERRKSKPAKQDIKVTENKDSLRYEKIKALAAAGIKIPLIAEVLEISEELVMRDLEKVTKGYNR